MNVAHDVFSEINPAFCACTLAKFTEAFVAARGQGPEIPVAYLSLPVALSGDLEATFDGTNKNTGLLEWMERSPKVQVGLLRRVNDSMSIVTEAIRFGCFARVLVVSEHARIHLGARKITPKIVATLSADVARSLKRAERLGYWFAAAGSTKTVFDMMGLSA